jgi:hypothetical protein
MFEVINCTPVVDASLGRGRLSTNSREKLSSVTYSTHIQLDQM